MHAFSEANSARHSHDAVGLPEATPGSAGAAVEGLGILRLRISIRKANRDAPLSVNDRAYTKQKRPPGRLRNFPKQSA